MELPKCRLFLVVPVGLDSALAAQCLTAAVQVADVASLLIEDEGRAGETMVETLRPVAYERGIAVLIAGDWTLVRTKLDGVQVRGDLQVYGEARRILGAGTIVGAECASRHQAMEFGEAGADYVGFRRNAWSGDESLIHWWAELFQVPCVALDPAEPDEAADLASQGADFVRPSDRIWTSPAAAREVAAATAAAIAGTDQR